MRKRLSVVLAACVLAGTLPLSGQTDPGSTSSLPDTPQGRVVAEYIQAFNTGQPEAVARVLDAYATPEALKRRTPEQRADAYQQLREEFGSVRVTRVVGASETEIVIAVPRKDTVEALWTFVFEPGRPVRFAGITVRSPPAP
jgi:outer membrane PBP1 activator LpoA protein